MGSKSVPDGSGLYDSLKDYSSLIMTAAEAQARLDEIEALDYSQFYVDGKRDINRVKEMGYGWLLQSFTLDKDGRLIDFTLAGDTCGSVYLIRAANGLIKIGRSMDVAARFSQLDSASPVPLELLRSAFVPDAAGLESKLHEMFAEKRARGEWFRLGDDDLNKALTLLSEHESTTARTRERG